MNRLSKIFQPIAVIPKGAVIKHQETTSISQKLMLELGLIKPAGTGTFHVLPIVQRALDKCIKLVEKNLNDVDAQKVSLPILTPSSLWEKSGRLNDFGELLIAKDRHGKDHILSPTHEESITSLMSSVSNISYKNFPLRLYQIGPKFRDELKPRFGLIRAREFIMKDLYTFDIGYKEAEKTYNDVNRCYENFFNQLEIPWIKVEGSAGMMGGNMSHEYHILANIGEDNIVKCINCDFASNEEVCGKIDTCPKCKSANIELIKGIEIGHTFLLGDKYSKSFNATFLQSNGKPKNLIMGCYGIGITRLLAASLEALSNENALKWPQIISPFEICIIPPKEGSKEESVAVEWISKICSEIEKFCQPNSILLDDRKSFTIGKRLMDCKRTGYPVIIVVGSKVLEPHQKFELHTKHSEASIELNFNELLAKIKELHLR